MSDLVKRLRDLDAFFSGRPLRAELLGEAADRIEELEREIEETHESHREFRQWAYHARREALEEAFRAVLDQTKAPPQRNAKDLWVEEIGNTCAAAIRKLMEPGDE